MKYEEVPDFNDKNIQLLNSSEPEKMVMPLLSVVMYGGNYDLAVTSARRFVKHPNANLRGVAIECVSHIARLWGSVPKDLIEEVNNAFEDPNEWVQGKADYAADDLEVFIKDYKRPK